MSFCLYILVGFINRRIRSTVFYFLLPTFVHGHVSACRVMHIHNGLFSHVSLMHQRSAGFLEGRVLNYT